MARRLLEAAKRHGVQKADADFTRLHDRLAIAHMNGLMTALAEVRPDAKVEVVGVGPLPRAFDE